MSLRAEFEQINHKITLDQAVGMIKRYRQQYKMLTQSEFASSLPYAETFNKTIFADLANQPDCVAIRSYLGMDDQNNVRMIFVGVNDKNEDILPAETGDGGSIYEFGQRCPPICAVSPLNPEE